MKNGYSNKTWNLSEGYDNVNFQIYGGILRYYKVLKGIIRYI